MSDKISSENQADKNVTVEKNFTTEQETETVEELENKGDSETESNNENTEPKEEPKEEESKTFNNAKDSSNGLYDSLALSNEVTKLETIIENSSKSNPTETDFYKNLDNYLSEEDKQLFFEDDKTAYFEAIEKAKNEFLNNQKADTSEQEKELNHLKGRLAVATAIETVLEDPSYKDFNFVKLQEFYNDELTGKEQRELDKGSTKEDLPKYFKKIHDLYKSKKQMNIKKVDAPNIPDASNLSKTTIEDKEEIDNKKKSEKYRESIGFKKL